MNGVWSALILDLFMLAGYVFEKLGRGSLAFVDFTLYLVLAGVLVATLTMITKKRWDESKTYLKSATDLMEKAYKVLSDHKDDEGRPKNSRLNWLTAARLVKTSQLVASHIDEESHRRIWKDQRIYWRAQIRSLIMPTEEGFPATYYAESAEKFLVYSPGRDQEPLSERSIAVLHHFIQWRDGEEDPIQG